MNSVDINKFFDKVEQFDLLKSSVRSLITGVKIILDQEQFMGTLDYCGKNVFKDLKRDVELVESLLDGIGTGNDGNYGNS